MDLPVLSLIAGSDGHLYAGTVKGAYRSVTPPTSAPGTGGPSALGLDVVPNPTLAGTTLQLSVPGASVVTVAVFDIRGRLQKQVYSGSLPPGRHAFAWSPEGAGSGVYVCRVTCSNEVASKKLVVLGANASR